MFKNHMVVINDYKKIWYYPVFADRCPVLPFVKHSQIQTPFLDLPGSKVSVLCMKGYSFSDGSKVKDIQCLGNSVWSDITHCEGKYTQFYCYTI